MGYKFESQSVGDGLHTARWAYSAFVKPAPSGWSGGRKRSQSEFGTNKTVKARF